MLLFLSLTGIIVSLILVAFNARRYRSTLYLGGFFFLVSLYAFSHFVIVDSHSTLLYTIFFVHPSFLYYLKGPLLYLYFRSVLTDQTRSQKRDWWHLLPALIFLVSTIPYFFLPFETKVANASQLAEDIVNLKFIKTSMLLEFVHPAFLFISRPLLVLGYAIGSLVIFIRWLKQRKNTYWTHWLADLSTVFPVNHVWHAQDTKSRH